MCRSQVLTVTGHGVPFAKTAGNQTNLKVCSTVGDVGGRSPLADNAEREPVQQLAQTDTVKRRPGNQWQGRACPDLATRGRFNIH
jgi:hypothetical protein